MRNGSPNSPPDQQAEPRRDIVRRPQDALYRIFRWIGRHVRGFYAAVGVFLAVGLFTALVSLGMFTLLAEWVLAGVVQELDEAAVIWSRSHAAPVLDALALMGAVLGSGSAAWIVILAGTLLLWRTGHRYSASLLWVSLGGARILNQLLKRWFDRLRPALFERDIELLGWTFDFPTSGSFPAGHALTSTVILRSPT